MNSRVILSSAIVLLIVTILGAALLVGLNSESRIATARGMNEARLHQAALADLLALMAGAEATQRKYLMTEDPSYLTRYRSQTALVSTSLRALQDGAVADSAGDAAPAVRTALMQLARQCSQVLTELELTLEAQRRVGREAAVAAVQDHAALGSMKAVEQSVGRLNALLHVHIDRELIAWEEAIGTSRMLLVSSTALNALILVGAGFLLARQLGRTDLLNEQLTRHAGALESQVEHRTAELSSLSSHLLRVAEHEKAAIARELHDELGGLMIAAKMDAAWLERHPEGSHEARQKRWTRLQQVLDDGLNLKRRVIEALRPTLLDNLGLVPALNWVYQETCGRAGINCKSHFPATDVCLSDEASIAVFRVVQESLANIVKHANASDVELSMAIIDEQLRIVVTDNGVGMRIRPVGQVAQGIASMRHRIHSLGGTLNIAAPNNGGTRIEDRLPLANITAPEAVSEEPND